MVRRQFQIKTFFPTMNFRYVLQKIRSDLFAFILRDIIYNWQ